MRGRLSTTAHYGSSAHSPRFKIQQGIAKCLGLLLIILFIVGSSWPSVFKALAGFAVFALVLTAIAIGPVLNPGTRARTQVLIASLAFVAFGAIILGLSVFHFFDIEPTLQLRSQYLLRQAYFLFLWIPFLLGALSFWNALGSQIVAVCRQWGIPLLVILAVSDIGTALLLGNQKELSWVGYLYFLDKFGFQFTFSLIYLLYVSHERHWILCLLLITAFAAASKLLHAGVMFNATTGAIFYLFLVTSTVPLASRRLQASGVVCIYLALVSFLVIGLLFPDWLSQDRNDQWRLMAWRSNFEALWRSGLAGVGFGTPYFAVTADNMLNTMNNQFNSLSADLMNSTDPQYVRAQHSSIVNMFYRLGLVGGGIFLYFNILVARIGFSNLSHPSPAITRTAYAAFVLFVVQAVQMTVHVGLETPIFLSIYMLSVAFILHVAAAASGIAHNTDVALSPRWRFPTVTGAAYRQ
jgi:hypothetical protein